MTTTPLQTQVASGEKTSRKGQPNGYPPLDANALIPPQFINGNTTFNISSANSFTVYNTLTVNTIAFVNSGSYGNLTVATHTANTLNANTALITNLQTSQNVVSNVLNANTVGANSIYSQQINSLAIGSDTITSGYGIIDQLSSLMHSTGALIASTMVIGSYGAPNIVILDNLPTNIENCFEGQVWNDGGILSVASGTGLYFQAASQNSSPIYSIEQLQVGYTTQLSVSATSTTNTTVRLTQDNSGTPNLLNSLPIGSNYGMKVIGQASAHNVTTGDLITWDFNFCIKNESNVISLSPKGAVITLFDNDPGANGLINNFSITVDSINRCVNFTGTGLLNTTISWQAQVTALNIK